MRLHALNVGVEVVDVANTFPLSPEVGTKVRTPYFVYLVEHPDGPVLVDTGAHRRYVGRYARDPAAVPAIVMAEGEDVVGRLATVGVAPEDVRHVVLTHLHVDHAGGIERFPHATFHVQAAERRAALDPPVYQRGFYVREDFDLPVDWHEVDGEHDLLGDGTIVLVPTPGHSVGHQSVLVRLPGRPVVLVGDAAYSPRSLEERILPAILWSPDAMVESWERLEALRDREGALLLYTHDLDWRTSTRLAPGAWYA